MIFNLGSYLYVFVWIDRIFYKWFNQILKKAAPGMGQPARVFKTVNQKYCMSGYVYPGKWLIPRYSVSDMSFPSSEIRNI